MPPWKKHADEVFITLHHSPFSTYRVYFGQCCEGRCGGHGLKNVKVDNETRRHEMSHAFCEKNTGVQQILNMSGFDSSLTVALRPLLRATQPATVPAIAIETRIGTITLECFLSDL